MVLPLKIYKGECIKMTTHHYVIKIFITSIIIVWAGAVGAIETDVQGNNTVTLLNAYDKSNQLFALLENKLKKKGSEEEMKIYAHWLEQRALSQSSNFRYPMYASLYQNELKDEVKASQLMIYAIVLQYMDLQRCKNKQIVDSVYKSWKQKILQSSALEYFKSLPSDDRAKMVNIALDLEEKIVHRTGDLEMCRDSQFDYNSELIYRMRTMATKKMTQQELRKFLQKIRNDLNNEIHERSFISDASWLDKRPENIQKIRKSLMEIQ